MTCHATHRLATEVDMVKGRCEKILIPFVGIESMLIMCEFVLLEKRVKKNRSCK